ncbi:carbohydrate-binding protein [Flavobacterium piscis]|uniref:Repeat protein (TIGR02059 family) n=1 Tax=Flavobacterium piscis TaxID=1114874 RepID=A0ABU1Y8X8_9FLAO|nr:carbohydrate-binding protein [Flavobacterium piscis]MDR7210697.1 putative repeat protein (TIGR02059 family) [Flavobacterium piscis]
MMHNQLLQGSQAQDKTRITIAAEKIISRQFLFVLLSFFLISFCSTAQESIQVGTATRQMIVYAPTGIEQNRPLVISMHGRGQTMSDQKNQTQFQSVAQSNNFVLVFPQSDGENWQLWGDNDINFILAIIEEMSVRYGIDRNRVYLSGFSMGGMMTYYAATKIADKIAAYAPVGGFLMGGPDTNSSRPIPIIHIHGEDDDFVPNSRVQECMDAWIARNGCPTTPVVTDPYPANVSTAKSVKKYWGLGKEKVEMVSITVAGVGHWYSDNNWSADGIFSSQEIWNFCSKYSLKDGVSEFESASVTDSNPNQIQLVLTKPVVAAANFSGFTVKIDGVTANINSIVLSDTNKLTFDLSQNILKDNTITISYANGNVVSADYEKKLIDFSDKNVDNLLTGASPLIIEASVNANGDALLVKFNKEMQLPVDVSALKLNVEYNGQKIVSALQGSFFNNDTSILSFSLGETIYRDYNLSLTYSGNNIASAENGLLKTISNFPVTNNSNGLPVHITSGKIEDDGTTLSLNFSKQMTMTNTQSGDITLNLNGTNIAFSGYTVANKTIRFTLSKSVHYGDVATISYAKQSIMAADKGLLEVFNNFSITNQLSAPSYKAVPGKIEAENFLFKSGMQAETTGDVGGGQNLGHIGDGNWAEYAIENNSPDTEYQISFRLASPNTGGMINFYIDDISVGSVSAPNTGHWQVYESVVSNITISQGKHYLKVVATKAGFNFNYMDIQAVKLDVNKVTAAAVSVYPNPVSNELIVNSADFHFDKIEIFDALGRLVMSKTVTKEPVLHIPIHLSNGLYFVKISNNSQHQLKKIIVVNK